MNQRNGTRKVVTLKVEIICQGVYYEADELVDVAGYFIYGAFEDRDDFRSWTVTGTVTEDCGPCAHCGQPIPLDPVNHTWISSDPAGLERYHIGRPACRTASGDPMPGTTETEET